MLPAMVDGDGVLAFNQLPHDMGADESRSANYQNVHRALVYCPANSQKKIRQCASVLTASSPGLKPGFLGLLSGTTEVVPFQRCPNLCDELSGRHTRDYFCGLLFSCSTMGD